MTICIAHFLILLLDGHSHLLRMLMQRRPCVQSECKLLCKISWIRSNAERPKCAP